MATALVRIHPRAATLELAPIAAFPGFRALLWSDDGLYASRGYSLYKTSVTGRDINWKPVAHFSMPLLRSLTSRMRFTSRLFRDGFHALATLRSGHLIAAVPGAILTLPPGENAFLVSHRIARGTRPLHIAVTPDDRIFVGEYFDNQERSEVHIYTSSDCGRSWAIAYTFAPGEIRHVHNVIFDPWQGCLWILTGDSGPECRIISASCDFARVETILAGSQQTRAAALVPTREGVVFSTDTPSQQNHIYLLDRSGNLETLAELSSSSIYGCAAGSSLFFSTMAEPSSTNTAEEVRLYGSVGGAHWENLLQYKKDRWPMRLFQYGNIFLPDGLNRTSILALTTCAVSGADLVTSLWTVQTE
jgi:hypothetical protein